jgi:nucleoside phosphorylase
MGGAMYGSAIGLSLRNSVFRRNNITGSGASAIEVEGGGLALQGSNATIQWCQFVQVCDLASSCTFDHA